MRKKMNKLTNTQAKTAGERIMIDTSSVRINKKSGIKKYWLLIVDEATGMKWSHFINHKDDQIPLLINFLKKYPQVKNIRCDNAGENYSLRKEVDKNGFNVNFEFTARKTPQQNGKVERAFATLYGRMRAMMIGAGLSETQRQ